MARSENELAMKKEENAKLKNKNTVLKKEVQKMEVTEKKLRNLVLSKEQFMIGANNNMRQSY
jgi:hypothetical protein